MQSKMKIKKGDSVIVITGKDKGKKGLVTKVFPKEHRLLVEGVNCAIKHSKPSQRNAEGGKIVMEKSIHYSNVQIVDPKLEIGVKIGYKLLSDNKKVRFSRKSQEILDNA